MITNGENDTLFNPARGLPRSLVHFYACQASQDETAASRGGSNITLELYLPLIKPGISVLVHSLESWPYMFYFQENQIKI